MDNVMLVHHSASSDLLIQNSIAAVTLTGTTVLEALPMAEYWFRVLGFDSTGEERPQRGLVRRSGREFED